jgi:hypothetical protein
MNDEPNYLAQYENPPVLANIIYEAGTNGFSVTLPTLKGMKYRLDRADDSLIPNWQGVSTSEVEQLPWSFKTLRDTNQPAETITPIFRAVAY